MESGKNLYKNLKFRFPKTKDKLRTFKSEIKNENRPYF